MISSQRIGIKQLRDNSPVAVYRTIVCLCLHVCGGREARGGFNNPLLPQFFEH